MSSNSAFPLTKPQVNEKAWLRFVVFGNLLLMVLLASYLRDLSNPLIMCVCLVAVHVLRTYRAYNDDNVLAPNKVVGLMTLTTITGAAIAIFARPGFIFLVHQSLADPEVMQGSTGEYLAAFRNKVVGYGSFWYAGYLFASWILWGVAHIWQWLRYPRTKLDIFGAFYDAAGNSLKLDQVLQIEEKAKAELAKEKGPYIARLPS